MSSGPEFEDGEQSFLSRFIVVGGESFREMYQLSIQIEQRTGDSALTGDFV